MPGSCTGVAGDETNHHLASRMRSTQKFQIKDKCPTRNLRETRNEFSESRISCARPYPTQLNLRANRKFLVQKFEQLRRTAGSLDQGGPVRTMPVGPMSPTIP